MGLAVAVAAEEGVVVFTDGKRNIRNRCGAAVSADRTRAGVKARIANQAYHRQEKSQAWNIRSSVRFCCDL